jgi:hypothetical protein
MNKRDGKVLPAFRMTVCFPVLAMLLGVTFLRQAARFLLLRSLVVGYSCA